MAALTAKDLRAVLDIVYALGDDRDGGEMPGHVLAQLRSLMGCESVTYVRVEPTTGRLLGSSAEPSEMDITGLQALTPPSTSIRDSPRTGLAGWHWALQLPSPI